MHPSYQECVDAAACPVCHAPRGIWCSTDRDLHIGRIRLYNREIVMEGARSAPAAPADAAYFSRLRSAIQEGEAALAGDEPMVTLEELE